MTGWKLTPSKPSLLMLTEGGEAIVQEYCDHREWDTAKDAIEGLDHELVWNAMLQASPTPSDEVLERMARAFVEAWQPKLGLMDEEMRDAREAMRAALLAAEQGGEG